MADHDIFFEAQEGSATNPEDECKCSSSQCREILLSRELDNILDPKVIFQPTINQFDKIISLMIINNKQIDVQTFLALLAEYRTERHCGLAWPPNSIAYRCRTCSKALTMALCADCFRSGDHEGHDYNMFKSRSGGACDCGYAIMKESGNCRHHGKNAIAKRAHEQIPETLICIPRRAAPRLIHRLAIQLRRSHVDLNGETDMYLDCLNQFANSSAVLRELLIDSMISEQDYSSQLELLSNHHDRDIAKIINEGLKKLKRERKGLISFTIPEDWKPPKDITAFCDNRAPKCFVDEFIFWLVLFEFPQKIVSFLLGFLMDTRYKKVVAKAFVNHYPHIVMILAGEQRRHLRDSYEQLSRRIVQISVQIHYDADLIKTLIEEHHTIHTLIYCLRIAIEGSPADSLGGILRLNTLCSKNESTPKVVCCDNIILRDRHLGSFTEDLNAILDFEAIRLVSDKDLLNTWIEMLNYFQTMGPFKRELTEHTPYETGPHVSVFTIEADFCLSPLWSILSHLTNETVLPLTQSLLESLHSNLSIWFHRMNIGPCSVLDPYYMSFHIPVHRMFAATLRHLLFIQNMSDQDVYDFISKNQLLLGKKYGYRPVFGFQVDISTNDFLKILLLHPLQALTLYHETRSSMWTRNGLLIINQAVTYVHCGFCYSTIDLDMFLLKYCASKLNPNYFIRIVMHRFHAWKWFSFKSNSSIMNNASNDVRRLYHFNILPEQITQMVESSLLSLIQLLTLSIHCDISDREQTRQEMIALISVLDRSYSYLFNMLPERSVTDPEGTSDTFASLLDELTIYKPAQHGTGGNLQQGCYTLKPKIWDEEYNPIQIQYRFYQKKDYQMSLERFFRHSRLTGKLEKRYHPSALWLPLNIPKNIGIFGQLDLSHLLECPTLVGLVFSIIYKNLYYTIDVPDSTMAYAIHLLELSLRKSMEKSRDRGEEVKISKAKGAKKRNPSFTGHFCYRELTSFPSFFSSRGEAYIKGSIIYAVFDKQQQQQQHIDQKSSTLFPVVRHALDLAFDTTWFPFESIIGNCLVHVENVHSLPWAEFESMLKAQQESDRPASEFEHQQNQTSCSKSSGRLSSDSVMSCCEHEEEEDEDIVDDDYVEIDDVDDDDQDDLDVGDEDEDRDGDDGDVEDDEDEDDEDDQVDDEAQVVTESSIDRMRMRAQRAYDSYEIRQASLASQTVTNNSSPSVERGHVNQVNRRTQDRATNTHSFWANIIELHQQPTGGINPMTTSQNLTSTTTTSTTTQSSSSQSHNLRSVFARQPQASYLNATTLTQHSSPGNWGDSMGLVSSTNRSGAQESSSQQQQQHASQQAGVVSDEHQQPTASGTDPMNIAEDVEMITDSPDADPAARPSGQVATEVQHGGNGSRAFDSSTYEVIGNVGISQAPIRAEQVATSRQPLSSPSPPNQINAARPAEGDHTYSALDTTMEVESLPEAQSTALCLVPVHQSCAGGASSSGINNNSGSNRAEQSSQMYPENLVTERRAIRFLPLDPRPMIEGRRQPLALESGSALPSSSSGSRMVMGDTSSTLASTTRRHQAHASGSGGSRDERSLSEVDILTRFVSFFQSRQDSPRPSSRGFRQRQMARRGGYRGPVYPVPPFAVYNPITDTYHPRGSGGASTAPVSATVSAASRPSAAGNPPPPPPPPPMTYENYLRRHQHQDPPTQSHELCAPRRQRRENSRRSNACTLLNRVLSNRSQHDHDHYHRHYHHQQSQHNHQRSRRLKKDRMHHGESLLTLLLRLHAKYSQKARSYEYSEQRALANCERDRSRIGDGVHFVTIVLDLICTQEPGIRAKLNQLQELIWRVGEEAPSGKSNSTVELNSPSVSDNDRAMDSSKVKCDTIEIDIKTNSLEEASGSRGLFQQPTKVADDRYSSRITAALASNAVRGTGNPASVATTSGQHLGEHSATASPSTATSSSFAEATASSFNRPSPLTPAERRRRAKEFQSKLMADFASKQRAFIEKYESSSASQPAAHSKIKIEASGTHHSLDDEPINLSSKLSSGGGTGKESGGGGGITTITTTVSTNTGQETWQRQMRGCDKQEKQQLTQQSADKGFSGGPFRLGAEQESCVGGGEAEGKEDERKRPSSSLLQGSSFSGQLQQQQPTSSGSSCGSSATKQPTVYECCICCVEGPSDLANPLGQVVLLQSTSIYGHSHLRPRSERTLPCEESEYVRLEEETYAKYLERRIDLLCEYFSESSRLDSINIGAEGGVHVQSCGHYLHIECHQSYIKSLDQEDRLRSRNDSDEFLCPYCQKLANSVLPILTSDIRTAPNQLAILGSENLDGQIKLIATLLEQRIPPNQKELQSSATFCAHLTKATGPQYRLVRSNASMHSLFLFLTSIARTNLETEVIVRSSRKQQQSSHTMTNTSVSCDGAGSSSTAITMSAADGSGGQLSNQRRSCFQLLFHVLALNAQTLINDQWFTCDQVWSHLTHRVDEKNRLSVKPMNSEVPLLLRDPVAMLLQFLFAINDSLCHRDYFTCLVQILFNLTAIQSIALVLSYVKPGEFLFEEERQATTPVEEASGLCGMGMLAASTSGSKPREAKATARQVRATAMGEHRKTEATNDLYRLLKLVGSNLAPLLAPTTEEPLMNSAVRNCWPRFAVSTSAASVTMSNDEPRSLGEGQNDQILMIENRVKLACLPYLRAAAFLQHHLYDRAYPKLAIVDDELLTDEQAIEADFNTLTACLNLQKQHGQQSGNPLSSEASLMIESGSNSMGRLYGARGCSLMSTLNWPPEASITDCQRWQSQPPQGKLLIDSWSHELLRFGSEFSIAARTLLVCRSLAWHRPSLMKLPRSFDDIFMFYYRKKCSLCNQVPKDVAVCLVCGSPICFRVSCCKDRSRSRQVHSQHCGANTAVFLAVHTSSIVVVRGNRACVWGSVYLDAHDEEDNGLQRGKPLYLVPARIQLLEEQWLTHSFDHTCGKRWIYLQEN